MILSFDKRVFETLGGSFLEEEGFIPDQRYFPRSPCAFLVKWQRPGDSVWHEARCDNISGNGLAFHGSVLPAPGETLALILCWPEGHPTRAKGRVLWQDDSQPPTILGRVGVQLEVLSLAAQKRMLDHAFV